MLCMEQRKMVAARKRTRRDHVTHHVTHVIDDGGAADGPRKSHIHAKTIKSPVLPYNKWESQPVTAVSASKTCLSRPDSPLTGTHAGYSLGDGTLMLHHHATDSASVLELEVIYVANRLFHRHNSNFTQLVQSVFVLANTLVN